MTTALVFSVLLTAAVQEAPQEPARVAAPALVQEASPPSVFAAVQFPAVVDSFTNTRVGQQTNRLAGVIARYRSEHFDRAIVDVYLYPTLPGQDSLGSEAAVARAEYERSRDEVMAFRDAPGQPDAPELLTEDSLTVQGSDGQSYTGWRADFFVSMGNERPRSYLYVFRKDGGTVKFRISHPRELRVFMQPHLESFLGKVLGGVVLDPVWAEGRPAQSILVAELGDGRFRDIGFPILVDSLIAMSVSAGPNGEIGVQYSSAVDRRFQASVRLRPAEPIRDEVIRQAFLPRALEVRSGQLRASAVPEGATLEFETEAIEEVPLPDGASVPISRVEILVSTEAGAIHSHYFDFIVGPVHGQLRFGHDQALSDRVHSAIEGVLTGILRNARAGG